jgi:hypothetical protein
MRMPVPVRRTSLTGTGRPLQASAGALLDDLPLRRAHSASWFPSQVACVMERLPRTLCDYKVVTRHGALVFDVPPPDLPIAPVGTQRSQSLSGQFSSEGALTTQRGIMAPAFPALLRSRGRPSPLHRTRGKGSALPTDPSRGTRDGYPTERGGPPPLVGLSPGLCGPGRTVAYITHRTVTRIIYIESSGHREVPASLARHFERFFHLTGPDTADNVSRVSRLAYRPSGAVSPKSLLGCKRPSTS